MSKDQINVGLIGFGVVGGGTVRILMENAETIARRVGAPVVVKRIAVRSLDRKRDFEVDPSLLTRRAEDVTDDPEIDIVCELVGGMDPAYDLVMRAIRNGKNIVTANKEMMAKAGGALLAAAEQGGLDFSFEGSVAGGIPIIQPLRQALAGNTFRKIAGIVNGTTNYILSKMTSEDADFADVLAEAQARGYAEADPTSDVGGFDAQYKTAILAGIAFDTRIDLADISVEGITKIAKRDIEVAKDLGYVIKLLGIGEDLGGALSVRVHPALLPNTHPLASVSDVYNAVFVQGDAVGDVMFYGRGAGSMPTGSAIVGDIIETARNIRSGATGRMGGMALGVKPAVGIDLLEAKFYVRLVAHDRPKVLASIASVFGDFDVSIESVVQRALPDGDAEIVWITHKAIEANLRSALDVIGRLKFVVEVRNSIRVEE